MRLSRGPIVTFLAILAIACGSPVGRPSEGDQPEPEDGGQGQPCWDGSSAGGSACLQGGCGNPIDLPFSAGEKASLEGAFQPMQVGEACGVPGQEMIFRLVAPEDGVLVIDSSAAFGSSVSLRTQCDATESELACDSESGLRTLSTPVATGQPIYVVLSAHEDRAAGSFFRISTQIHAFRFRGPGEQCSDRPNEQCAPGSNCLEARKHTCLEALVASNLQVTQGGPTNSDLTLSYSAAGPIWAGINADIRVTDEAGIEITVFDHPTARLEGDLHYVDQRLLPGVLPAGFKPEAVSVRLFNGGWGAPTSTNTIEQQPMVSIGQPCDPTYTDNRCEDTAACLDTGLHSICMPLSDGRIEHCQMSPSMEIGENIVVDSRGRGLWEVSRSCATSQPNSRAFPEALFRLHLDRDRSNVDIDAFGGFLPIVSLFRGCGEEEVEDTGWQCNMGMARYSFLERGDYLVVIKNSKFTQRWPDSEYHVTVSADP